MPRVSSSIRIADPVAVALGDRAVGGQLGLPLAGASLGLERLVHVRRRALDGLDVRVVVGQAVQLVEHAHRDREVVGVDAGEELGMVGKVRRDHRRILGPDVPFRPLRQWAG